MPFKQGIANFPCQVHLLLSVIGLHDELLEHPGMVVSKIPCNAQVVEPRLVIVILPANPFSAARQGIKILADLFCIFFLLSALS